MSLPYIPTTVDELVSLIRDGVLVEGQGFDAKERIDAGEKANRNLAIDLAAMSITGGLIAVGIAERGGSLQPSPIHLAGLRERASQIALSRPDPPIFPTTRELYTDEAKDLGILLLIIPPSPDAPHQVDGAYRGRGDTTNYIMGDAEVRSIQAGRIAAHTPIRVELQAAIANDPFSIGPRHGHMFVVGRPVISVDPTMLQSRIGAKWAEWINGPLLQPVRIQKFSPSLASVHDFQRRPNGWAASHGLTPTRSLQEGATESGLIELEVDENGSLRLYCARVSDSVSAADPTRWVIDDLVTGLAWSIIRCAATISETTSYVGNWEFGLGITNAWGLRSYGIRTRWTQMAYGANEYLETTLASPGELFSSRDAVVARLLARWNRALTDDTVEMATFG